MRVVSGIIRYKSDGKLLSEFCVEVPNGVSYDTAAFFSAHSAMVGAGEIGVETEYILLAKIASGQLEKIVERFKEVFEIVPKNLNIAKLMGDGPLSVTDLLGSQ